MEENNSQKVEDIFIEFIHSLAMLTPNPIDKIKISLPLPIYKQIEYTLMSNRVGLNTYLHCDTQTTLNTGLGSITLTTPELEQIENRRKLEECFKILSK